MTKVLKSYYGWDYSEIDSTKSETSVEVRTADGKYNANFKGINHTKQAISFVNSVLTLVGKTDITYCRMSSNFYYWVEEEEKKEE